MTTYRIFADNVAVFDDEAFPLELLSLAAAKTVVRLRKAEIRLNTMLRHSSIEVKHWEIVDSHGNRFEFSEQWGNSQLTPA